MADNSEHFFKRITRKYRLTIFDEQSLNEVFSMPMSKLKGWLLVILFCMLMCGGTVTLLFYTPLKHLVPGYPSKEVSQKIRYTALMTDSLLNEIERRDEYLLLIRKAISGEVVGDTQTDGVESFSGVTLEPVSGDSIFDELIGPEKYRFTYRVSSGDELSRLNFFSPVRGMVTNRFNASPGHFGTDIVGTTQAHIASVLDGTVIFSEWSITTGYVVGIQHENNLVSIYKHNSEVLVSPGEQVRAGDVIAFMGNEGEYSTGPHLHFELWHGGTPLDPEQYIAF
ncbi:MAG: M23 family metallopeptidase [Prolixibacteraceae bacterium]|nr:M23 family metallopeptidase [Prolixibacteraceae bacterium]